MTANPTAPPPVDSQPPDAENKESAGSSIAFTATLILLVGLALFGRRIFAGVFSDDGIRTWATMFVGVTVQAMPFLVLGVLLSAALTAFIPAVVLREGAARSTRPSPYRSPARQAWYCRAASVRRCRCRPR